MTSDERLDRAFALARAAVRNCNCRLVDRDELHSEALYAVARLLANHQRVTFTSLKHALIDLVRKRRREALVNAGETPEYRSAIRAAPRPDERALSAGLWEHVHRIVGHDRAMVLLMVCCHKERQQDAAKRLGISQATVSERLNKALALLREHPAFGAYGTRKTPKPLAPTTLSGAHSPYRIASSSLHFLPPSGSGRVISDDGADSTRQLLRERHTRLEGHVTDNGFSRDLLFQRHVCAAKRRRRLPVYTEVTLH